MGDKALIWQDVLLALNLVGFFFYLLYTRHIALSANAQTEGLSRPVVMLSGFLDKRQEGDPFPDPTPLDQPFMTVLSGAIQLTNVGNGPALSVKWKLMLKEKLVCSAVVPYIQAGHKENTGVLSSAHEEFDFVVEYSSVSGKAYRTTTHLRRTAVMTVSTEALKP